MSFETQYCWHCGENVVWEVRQGEDGKRQRSCLRRGNCQEPCELLSQTSVGRPVEIGKREP